MEEQIILEKKPIEKKKVWLIVGGSIIGLAIMIGILLAFLLNYNSNAPDKVKIENQEQTYFSVNANDNYRGYRFIFVSDSDTITVDSLDSVLLMDDVEGLIPGQEYQVSACYLGQSEGANSDYSEPITWICTFKLDSPEIVYDNQTNIISWNVINDADFYNVTVISGSKTTIYDHVLTNNFDLNQVDGGNLKIYVCALSSSPYLIQSNYSAVLSTTFYKSFKPLLSASLDRNDFILTIIAEQELKEIDIQINHMWISCIVSPLYTNGNYQYQITLSDYASVISLNSVINVRPSTLDEYNVYNGQVLQVQIVWKSCKIVLFKCLNVVKSK